MARLDETDRKILAELQSDAEKHVLREGQENGEPLDMRQLHAIVTALGDITQVLK